MPLHRYVTPTYFGGLPVTHDLINVTSGGIGAGDGSSLVAPQKPGPHPNAGTYFVAFGEDATSGNTNRGLKALAENTDFLDDIVHADQSIPTVSAAVVPGAPVSSVVIPGNVFVGSGGELNDQRTRSGLVAVLDGDGIPLHILSGSVYVPVLISKIHDGLGSSVLGTGYFTNPTVDFVPAIPAAQAYRLVHYLRGNLKTQPPRTYTRLADGIRGTEDLWAYSKTTREGTATFTGVKTFVDNVFFGPSSNVEFQQDVTFTPSASLIAQGPVTLAASSLLTSNADAIFNGVVQFNDGVEFNSFASFKALAEFEGQITTTVPIEGIGTDYEVPLLTTDVAGDDDTPDSDYRLIFSFKTASTGTYAGVYARIYTRPADGGYVLTLNAVWDQGTTQWSKDDTGSFSLRVATSLEDALKWEAKPITGTPWADNNWDGFIAAGMTAAELFFGSPLRVDFDNATVPALLVDRVASDSPGGSNNPWKLLTQFATGDLAGDIKVRLYSGNFNTLTGLFALTVNCAWNGLEQGSGGGWLADENSFGAFRISLDGLRVLISTKGPTVGLWDDNAWDFGGVPDSRIAISGEYTYTNTKSRVKIIPLAMGLAGDGGGGIMAWRLGAGTAVWGSVVNSGQLSFPIDIPSGCTLTQVRALVDPGNALTMTLQLIRTTTNFTTPLASVTTVLETVNSDGTTALQLLDTGPISYSVTHTTRDFMARVTATSNGGSVIDLCYGIEITYDDPGPRNF